MSSPIMTLSTNFQRFKTEESVNAEVKGKNQSEDEKN
jgi:hypothetical protein